MAEAWSLTGIRCDGGCARELGAGEWTWLCMACDHEVCAGCAGGQRSRRLSCKGAELAARGNARGKRARAGEGDEPTAESEAGRSEDPSDGGDAWPEARRRARRRLSGREAV